EVSLTLWSQNDIRQYDNLFVDLQYLNDVIVDGADPNPTDNNLEVVECGADVLSPDSYGVTPLHIAAALDYVEMIHFPLERKADIGAKTNMDHQTPLHYANEADISAQDYKKRTPLQLAANLGGHPIALFSSLWSCQAHLVMNQFHVTERMTRQQFYSLHLLEPEHFSLSLSPQWPFIVHQGKLDLIMHPVVLKLITVKWKLYGRLGAWILLLLNLLFIVSWTTVAISVSVIRDKKPYVFPEVRNVFGVVATLGLTVVEVGREVAETIGSRRKLRKCTVQRYIFLPFFCLPAPKEKHFLEEQIKIIRRMKGNYLQDPWNIFDWPLYILLMAVFGIHVADIILTAVTKYNTHNTDLRIIHNITPIPLLFILILYRVMIPFIVMPGKIVGDVLPFLFLYAEIFVPYARDFWIMFQSMQTVPQLLYSLYRITLVDEHEFNSMVEVDSIVAHFLCGTFLALSSILCVNLMIALLSDTFQRVYDNALANAVMQQAAIILQVEESMPRLCRFYDDHHIQRFLLYICTCLWVVKLREGECFFLLHMLFYLFLTLQETLDEFLEMQNEVNRSEQGRSGDSDRGSGSAQHCLSFT
uniref:Si:ch73-193i2.2 n=1 Tax=Oncorhynchus kisutch TaxID=8019 RepID=A0A8C7CKV6_ONCKI